MIGIETLIDGSVNANFEDGTTYSGSMIIGADGNNSAVRKFLFPESYKLNLLPVNLVGVIRHFTPEQGMFRDTFYELLI